MKLIEIADSKEAKTLRRVRSKLKPKSLEEVAKKYKQNIRAVLDKQLYFFRASESHRPTNAGYDILDGASELNWYEQPKRIDKRDSIFGNGNWLMSWTESAWQDYPKRSMSYFATQSQKSAQNFGRGDQVLMIIPADDVESFGVMETDFNEASTEAQTLMSAIQSLLVMCRQTIGDESTPLLMKLNREVFRHRGINFYDDDLKKPNAEKVKAYIAALDELMDNIFQIQQRVSEAIVARAPGIHKQPETKLLNALKSFRSELKEMGYASLEEYVQSITPQSMGAKLYTDFRHIKSSPSKDDELWFEGSYLGIYWYDEDDTIENLQLLYDKL